jgi:hypothetical protein
MLALAGAMALGVAAAMTATGAPADGSGSLALRAMRRADLLLLAVAGVLVALRAAGRLDEDRRSGWLVPYCAANGRRMAYTAALGAAVALPVWLAFAAGAAAFAFSVQLRTGSTELVRAWLLLAPAGLLLLLVVAAHVLAVGIHCRDPLFSILAAAALAVAPYAAVAAFLARQGFGPTPPLLRLWVQAALPFAPAAAWPELARQLAYLCGAGLLAMAASARGVGRCR